MTAPHHRAQLAIRVQRLEAAVSTLGADMADMKVAVKRLPQTIRQEVLEYTEPVFGEIMAGHASLATKEHLDQLEQRMAGQLGDLEQRMVGQLGDLEQRMVGQLGDLEQRMVGQLGDLEQRMAGQLGDLEQRMVGQLGDLEQRMAGQLGDLEQRLEQSLEERLGGMIDAKLDRFLAALPKASPQ